MSGQRHILLGEGIGCSTGIPFLVCKVAPVEDGTVLNYPAVVCTLVNCRLQDILLPTVQEVAVKTVTGWVTIRQHVTAGQIQLVDGSHIIVDLEKDGDQVHWMRWGTGATIDAGRVSDMIFMIGTVEIDTIPTPGEKDYPSHLENGPPTQTAMKRVTLSTQTLRTIGIVEARRFGSWMVIIDATPGDGFGGVRARVVACHRIAGDHLETRWKGFDLFILTTAL